jgi:hypothetical protein
MPLFVFRKFDFGASVCPYLIDLTQIYYAILTRINNSCDHKEAFMQQEEITAYVVKELAKNRNRQDLILTLCEKAKMSWPEAEKLVRGIESSHRKEIVTRQSPMLLIFSIGLSVLGLGMLLVGILGLSEGIGRTKSGLQILVVGALMLVGGVVGLWNTISALFREK